MHHGEGKVLVEEVAEEFAHAQVRPAAVDEEQALEELELGEGVVGGQHGLDALLPADAHADVGGCHQPGREEKQTGCERAGFKAGNYNSQGSPVLTDKADSSGMPRPDLRTSVPRILRSLSTRPAAS